MKRISLETLMKRHPNDEYEQQYAYIMRLLAEGTLKPVKSAGTNGRKPALCLSYWVKEEADESLKELEEELKFSNCYRLLLVSFEGISKGQGMGVETQSVLSVQSGTVTAARITQ